MFNFKPYSFVEERAGPGWIWMGDSRQRWHVARNNIWLQTDIPEQYRGVGTRCPCPPLSGLPPPGLWEPSCPFQSSWAQLVSANPSKLNWESWEEERPTFCRRWGLQPPAAVQMGHKPHPGTLPNSEPHSRRPRKPCCWQAFSPKLYF